jgi:hypothetical protein
MKEEGYNSYAQYFQLRNRDPSNYVLYKDFYFYSIIAIYIFYFWFLITVFINAENLERTNEGMLIIALNYIVLIGTVVVLLLGFINKERFPYPLAGIIFIVFLAELASLVAFFDKKDLDPSYEKDPVTIAFTFLILYAFVSYFTC